MKFLSYFLGLMLLAAAFTPEHASAQYLINQTGIAQPCIGENSGDRIRFVQTKTVDNNGIINQVNDNNGTFFTFAGNFVRLNCAVPTTYKYSHNDNQGNGVYIGCSNLNGREMQNNNDYLIISPDRNHINRVTTYGGSYTTVYSRQDTPSTQGMIY